MTFRLKKTIVLALLGAVLAVVLAACGGDDPTSTPRPKPTNTPVPAAAPAETAAPSDPEPAKESAGLSSSSDAASTVPNTPTPVPPTPTATATPIPTPTPDPGFDAEAYFKGKTISLMVGYGQGGGTDAQGRFMGGNWSKFIPGNPRIIVRNLTPNITERNYLWNAKPDGFTISVEANPGISDQLEAAAQFDMREVTHIGATSGGDGVWMIWNDVDYDCGDSAMGKTSPVLRVADTLGSWEAMGQQPFGGALAASLMDLPLEMVHIAGDTGTNTQALLLERGDTNSWLTSTIWTQLPLRRPGWQADGTIKAFIDMSRRGVRVPDSSESSFDCGTVEDYVGTSESDVFYKFNDVGRAFAKNILGPPGMDDNVRDALRKALDDAINDPEFVAGLVKFSGIPLNYTPGAEFEAIMKNLTEGFIESQVQYDSLRQEMFDKYVK